MNRKRSSLPRLRETEGLTGIQEEILRTIRQFADERIIPVAQELEHADEYPTEIVEGLEELGLFGLTIPEEYGGLDMIPYSASANTAWMWVPDPAPVQLGARRPHRSARSCCSTAAHESPERFSLRTHEVADELFRAPPRMRQGPEALPLIRAARYRGNR